MTSILSLTGQTSDVITDEIELLPECANIAHTYLSLDIDECKTGTHKCNRNANCANTFGSHTCTCKPGFAGDGTQCSGKRLYDCTTTNKVPIKEHDHEQKQEHKHDANTNVNANTNTNSNTNTKQPLP